MGKAAWYGTDPGEYPDAGSLEPPTGSHVILAYEQQRWKNEPVKANDTDYIRIKEMVDAAHSNGAIALLCLGYGGDKECDQCKINREQDTYPEDQWTFPQSVLELVRLVGADGLDIDCEDHDTLREATTRAIREVFDKAGSEEGRKYFLTVDLAWGYEDGALKHCDMVLDQTYYSRKYSLHVPHHISGDKWVVGASYQSGSVEPPEALKIYQDHKAKSTGCLGCFLWNVHTDSPDWDAYRKYFTTQNIHPYEILNIPDNSKCDLCGP